MSEPKKFLSVKHIVFMIMCRSLPSTTSPGAIYQMGYSAIPILILAALLFFVPYSFMMAEYGSRPAGRCRRPLQLDGALPRHEIRLRGSLLNYAGTW